MEFELIIQAMEQLKAMAEQHQAHCLQLTLAVSQLLGYVKGEAFKQKRSQSKQGEGTTDPSLVQSDIMPGLLTNIPPMPSAVSKQVSAPSCKDCDEVLKYKNKTITQRSDGRWWTRIYKNGKQISIYGKTQKECLQNLKKALATVDNVVDANGSTTIGDWLEKWLQLYKVGKVKDTTVDKLRSLIKSFEAISGKQLVKITSLELQNFFNGVEHPRKREQMYVTLKDAFTKAYKNRLIKYNPFDVVEVAKAKKKRKARALTHEEETVFVQACKQHWLGNLYLMCLYQGLRLGEALALTVDDVDRDKRLITISKAIDGQSRLSTTKTESSNRTIPLFQRTLDILPNKREGRLFDDSTRKYYQKCMSTICADLGIEGISIHSLRHTFATRCAEAGVPPKVVQQWLGHSTLEMTMNVYTHVNRDFEREMTSKVDLYFDT